MNNKMENVVNIENAILAITEIYPVVKILTIEKYNITEGSTEFLRNNAIQLLSTSLVSDDLDDFLGGLTLYLMHFDSVFGEENVASTLLSRKHWFSSVMIDKKTGKALPESMAELAEKLILSLILREFNPTVSVRGLYCLFNRMS